MNHDMLADGEPEDTFAGEAQAWQNIAEQAQRAWAEGDYDRAHDAFLALQERSVAWLLAIARREGPADDAAEVAAQAYVPVSRMVQSGEPIQNVKGLLGTIARRRAVDALRRKAPSVAVQRADDVFWDRYEQATPDQDTPYEQLESRLSAPAEANTILDALPTDLREVLVARHMDELAVSEAATRLGITEDQVKKRTQAALAEARRIAREWGIAP
jgi:RNA polymerase sigma factor (sigma-70 family)